MDISRELVNYLEELARIRLNEDEQETIQKDLGDILNYINKLNELDTQGIDQMSHALAGENVFREDEVTSGNQRDVLLQNAPEKKNGCYKVPKTVE